jgi:16S rRNA (cytosine1402-N4)-methyltransferase
MRTRFDSRGDPVPAQLQAQSGHRSVLLHEALEHLRIQPDDTVVDATLGGAGHAREIARLLDAEGVLIGFDLDGKAIERARTALAGVRPRVHLIRENFRHIERALSKLDIKRINKVLFDLGWSGFQLAEGRGFSFLADEPLLMTYADSPDRTTLTARDIVNTWKEETLADILFGWGEERYSRRIARAIVSHRERKPFETARELAEVIVAAVPPRYRHGKLHPATRTFQSLRIATNDELGALTEGLTATWRMLAPGGRIGVITFHSVEDREVKRLMLGFEKEGEGKRVNRSVIRPGAEEMKANPRARSAKLRVIEKRIST